MQELTVALQQLTESIQQASSLLGTLPGARKLEPAREVPKLATLLPNSPLAGPLADDNVTDILINGPFEIYVIRSGQMERTDLKFPDEESLTILAESMVHEVGRRIDPRRPLVDARLHDGSRINIVAPPMAVAGLSMSIRKFSKRELSLEKLAEYGVMSLPMARFLEMCARARLNMLVCGGTGTGKTTLLNAISRYIPSHERVVTIEDTAELNLQQPHVVRLETKEPETLGDRTEEVNTSDLVRNALRMRPDRIVVGEVRGAEAYDMIQAMNTGHDGSMATIHANTPRDALTRLENLVAPSLPNTPIPSVRRQIVSALHMVIQVNHSQDGKRRVTSISEVIGMEGDVPIMQAIFTYKELPGKAPGKPQYAHEWMQVMPRHSELAALCRNENVFQMKA